jgi:hypothetical protein
MYWGLTGITTVIYEAYPQNKFCLQVLLLQRCAAVTTVHMCAEFDGPLGRHGRDLQIIELHLHIVLCVYNVKENSVDCRM